MMNQFILGTMRLDMNDKKSALAFLQKARALGIVELDTADIYGGYEMNAFLGSVMDEDKTLRDHFKVIGKTGIRSPKQSGTDYKHYDYSEAYILQAVEKMRAELGVEQIEYLLLHRPSPLMQFASIGNTLLKLQETGAVKKVGVSNFNIEEMKALSQYVSIAANQIEFSPLSYEHYDNNVLTYMQANQLHAQVWSPVAGGQVFSPSPLRDVLEKYANAFSVSIEAVVYAFISKLPVSTSIILGTTKKERLEVVKQMHKFELPLEAWFEIAAASQKYIVK